MKYSTVEQNKIDNLNKYIKKIYKNLYKVVFLLMYL